MGRKDVARWDRQTMGEESRDKKDNKAATRGGSHRFTFGKLGHLNHRLLLLGGLAAAATANHRMDGSG